LGNDLAPQVPGVIVGRVQGRRRVIFAAGAGRRIAFGSAAGLTKI